MYMISKSLLILCLSLTSVLVSGQEICDDGIDNDNDGLIDINDTEDCSCETLMPSSLIPNPSFEEMLCCPRFEGQLDCAVSWIQASFATSDYVHTCGILGNPSLQSRPPLPFPDGEGAVGFRDGKPNLPNNKEYVGSCLTEPMKQGVTYRLDFFVGFYDAPSSVYLPMAFFGTNNCNNLPFGGNNGQYGCPTNGPGWDLIGQVEVRGENEWVNVKFDFTPDQDYEAIVLGPGCAPHPDAANNPYFYVDRLSLAEASAFSVPLANITGEPCDDSLLLEAEPGQLSYQWYLNGVAIIGETSTQLSIDSNNEEGEYVVRIESQDGCFLSEPYDLIFAETVTFSTVEICAGDTYPLGQQLLSVAGSYADTVSLITGCDSISNINLIVNPAIESMTTQSICVGDTYPLGQQLLSMPGSYTDTISSASGCDSISNVELIVYPNTESLVTQTLCSGDTIQVAGQVFSQEGQYSIMTENANGCDSIVTVDITFESPIQNLSIDSIVTIALGDSITLSPNSASNDIVSYEWSNQGDIISMQSSVSVSPFDDSEYLITAYNAAGCSIQKRVTVIVDRNDDIYIPNIFSTSLVANKAFIVGTGSSIVNINSLLIYDRWGNIVHSYDGLVSEYQGWNGTFNSDFAEIGVYTYIVKLGLVNNEEILKTGNVTLLR